MVAGCEINDDPFAAAVQALPRPDRRSAATTRRSLAASRAERYVEKLATPDVTIADIIGDVDPIRAARGGLRPGERADDALRPAAARATAAIFALNELPDLAGRIQVGLFNILQEGDVQIKGYPVRLPIDVCMVLHGQSRGLHGARQDHHAAQGPHRQRDPHALPDDASSTASRSPRRRPGRTRESNLVIPRYVREVVEGIAFAARARQEDRPPQRRLAAPADQRARERGQQRRAARAGRRRVADRAAHLGRLRRAAVAHGQVRARVRGRAARRRRRSRAS